MSLKDLVEKTPQYGLYNKIVGELNEYRDENPMTDEQGNKFRHLAGSMGVAQKYGFLPANLMGLGKEYDDYFNLNKSGWDSIGDIGNNIIGSFLGTNLKYVPRQYMYKLIDKGFLR